MPLVRKSHFYSSYNLHVYINRLVRWRLHTSPGPVVDAARPGPNLVPRAAARADLQLNPAAHGHVVPRNHLRVVLFLEALELGRVEVSVLVLVSYFERREAALRVRPDRRWRGSPAGAALARKITPMKSSTRSNETAMRIQAKRPLANSSVLSGSTSAAFRASTAFKLASLTTSLAFASKSLLAISRGAEAHSAAAGAASSPSPKSGCRSGVPPQHLCACSGSSSVVAGVAAPWRGGLQRFHQCYQRCALHRRDAANSQLGCAPFFLDFVSCGLCQFKRRAVRHLVGAGTTSGLSASRSWKALRCAVFSVQNGFCQAQSKRNTGLSVRRHCSPGGIARSETWARARRQHLSKQIWLCLALSLHAHRRLRARGGRPAAQQLCSLCSRAACFGRDPVSCAASRCAAACAS